MRIFRISLFVSIVTLCFTLPLKAQFLTKVPKQYSAEFGYRNLFHQTHFNIEATHGYGALFDVAWQLSGFDGKKAKSFLSVPIGYTVLMGSDVHVGNVNMLNYGWTVRHELTTTKKLVPFVGYGLLLNNMRLDNVPGSLFGHQTQFDFGVNVNTKSRFSYFAKIQYSYTSYPQLNDPLRIRLHYADLRVGLRF